METRKSTGERISDIIVNLKKVFAETDILRRDERLRASTIAHAEILHREVGTALARAQKMEGSLSGGSR